MLQGAGRTEYLGNILEQQLLEHDHQRPLLCCWAHNYKLLITSTLQMDAVLRVFHELMLIKYHENAQRGFTVWLWQVNVC